MTFFYSGLFKTPPIIPLNATHYVTERRSLYRCPHPTKPLYGCQDEFNATHYTTKRRSLYRCPDVRMGSTPPIIPLSVPHYSTFRYPLCRLRCPLFAFLDVFMSVRSVKFGSANYFFTFRSVKFWSANCRFVVCTFRFGSLSLRSVLRLPLTFEGFMQFIFWGLRS